MEKFRDLSIFVPYFQIEPMGHMKTSPENFNVALWLKIEVLRYTLLNNLAINFIKISIATTKLKITLPE